MMNIFLRRFLFGFCLLFPFGARAQEAATELQLSSGDVICWYRICSAVPGMEAYAMTDLESDATELASIMIHLLPTRTDDYASQWKLTAGEDGKVILTNRATGSQISNCSFSTEECNATLLAYGLDVPGFTITPLGDNAFKLESVEDDGVNRCLALTQYGGQAAAYPDGGESTSVIGWKFFPVEIDTGIGSAGSGRSVIRVNAGRISVSGCSEWQLFNASGEEMPRTVALPTGVYVVKMQQKAVKILIP